MGRSRQGRRNSAPGAGAPGASLAAAALGDELRENAASLLELSTLRTAVGAEPAVGLPALPPTELSDFEQVKEEMRQAHAEWVSAEESKERLRLEAIAEAERPLRNAAATAIQAIWRGVLGRQKAIARRAYLALMSKQQKAALVVQRHMRGHFGRLQLHRERMRRLRTHFLDRVTSRIQSCYRGYVGRCSARALRYLRATQDI